MPEKGPADIESMARRMFRAMNAPDSPLRRLCDARREAALRALIAERDVLRGIAAGQMTGRCPLPSGRYLKV